MMGKEEEENISDDAQLIYRESMFQFAVMNVFACLKKIIHTQVCAGCFCMFDVMTVFGIEN